MAVRPQRGARASTRRHPSCVTFPVSHESTMASLSPAGRDRCGWGKLFSGVGPDAARLREEGVRAALDGGDLKNDFLARAVAAKVNLYGPPKM